VLRKWATSLLEVAGFTLIVGGIWTVSFTAGLIAAGAALVLIGVRLA
jgi:hypothetical protein